MIHLHQEIEAGPDDLVEVSLDRQANVMLLDPANYELYTRREKFRYHGGLAEYSPMRLVPPHEGKWHVVVDLGGSAGTVQAGIRVLGGLETAG
jgi:hypothetical protein